MVLFRIPNRKLIPSQKVEIPENGMQEIEIIERLFGKTASYGSIKIHPTGHGHRAPGCERGVRVALVRLLAPVTGHPAISRLCGEICGVRCQNGSWRPGVCRLHKSRRNLLTEFPSVAIQVA